MNRMTDPPRNVTGGVDTHAEVHVAAAVCSQSHQLLGCATFDTTPVGYVRLLAWLVSFGQLDRVGIEGTGTYGAGLARFLTAEGVPLVEVDRPDRAARRQHGKSDPIDAEAAARAVLSGRASGTPKSRDGIIEAIRVHQVVYRSAVRDRTAAINQFHAVVVSAPAEIREFLQQMPLKQRLERARRWRQRDGDGFASRATRQALRELALRIQLLDDQAQRTETELDVLTDRAAPALRDLVGVGIHTAARLLVTAGDNPERLHSEAAFAHLCGVAPIRASSGKTNRHRLTGHAWGAGTDAGGVLGLFGHCHTVLPLEGQVEFCRAGWSGTRTTGDRAMRFERRAVSLRPRVPNRERSPLTQPVRGSMMKHGIPAPTGAIDWASESHVGAVVDHLGELVAGYDFPHTGAGLATMLRRFARHGVKAVAIERPDGPVVETLLAADIEVFVISPRQLKNLRGRYGSAGNKDDAFDAFVLADVLRTDRRRLQPLERDSEPTRAMRVLTRARKDLIGARVALGNQLLANLQIALPGAIGLFHRLDSPISLAFLRRFPTADKAAWLSPKRLDAWLARQGYPGGKTGAALLAQFLTAPAGIRGPEADARATVTVALVDAIERLNIQIADLERQIRADLTDHPDAHIFTSLPKGGTIRAATLLAEIGDARGRFPTDDALAALAGAAPSTRSSGKLHTVTFRFACDKKLRDAIVNFADDSRHASPWAADIYQRARDRNLRHPHAIRILARAWIRVIWRCWQDHTPYDPTKHGGHQRLLAATA